MTNIVPKFAVMGNPIAHSLSPQIHQHFAKQAGIALSYEKILVDPDNFSSALFDFFHHGGKGLNITAPLKEMAFQLAQKHTERCVQAGSANTLWMEDGVLQADNTDGYGLVADLSQYLSLGSLDILILGAGGATRGILGPLLAQKPRNLFVANRSLERAQALQTIFADIQAMNFDNLSGNFDLIIHATSARSMQELPILAALLKVKPFCYDLNYDLKNATDFLTLATQYGCQVKDGLGMLIAQAAESFKIWHQLYDFSYDSF